MERGGEGGEERGVWDWGRRGSGSGFQLGLGTRVPNRRPQYYVKKASPLTILEKKKKDEPKLVRGTT